MEDLLKDALPKEVIEVQDAIQQVVEPEEGDGLPEILT